MKGSNSVFLERYFALRASSWQPGLSDTIDKIMTKLREVVEDEARQKTIEEFGIVPKTSGLKQTEIMIQTRIKKLLKYTTAESRKIQFKEVQS